MGFFKLIYIIPLMLFCNTIFIIQLHSTYLGAIDDLNKQREILEDAKYHIENEPNLEKLAEIQHTQQVFQQWWGDETEPKNGSTTLVIGIPAIPRPQRYLTQTLAAIALQLPSSDPNLNTPWRDKVSQIKIQVYIVNNKPESDFEEFYELKEKYGNTNEFVFIKNTEPQEDRYADQPEPDDFNNPNDTPGKKVRHQTYDLISLMKLVEGKSKYFLFMEDDFPICPKALDTFYYIIRKLGYYAPNWKAVRTSYGMNGIFVKGEELKSLATFFHNHVSHRPPDGLVVEWMCNSNVLTTTTCEIPQRHFTFKWNLFQHIGAVSSLRQTGLNKFPGCWAFYSHLLWTIDGFNANDCDEDDIWPCSVRPHTDVIHRNLVILTN